MILQNLAKAVREQNYYAVVLEFLIVIAGVVIGFQITAWYADRGDRQAETRILQGLATDIMMNVANFDVTIALDTSFVAACDHVINTIESDGQWSEETADSMRECGYWSSPHFITSTYDSLTSQGLQRISNEDVRQSVTYLHDLTFEFLVNDTDKFNWSFQEAVTFPIMNRYMRIDANDLVWPSDPQRLIDSDEFLNMLYAKNALIRQSLRDQVAARDRAKSVLSMIEGELQSRGDEVPVLPESFSGPRAIR